MTQPIQTQDGFVRSVILILIALLILYFVVGFNIFALLHDILEAILFAAHALFEILKSPFT